MGAGVCRGGLDDAAAGGGGADGGAVGGGGGVLAVAWTAKALEVVTTAGGSATHRLRGVCHASGVGLTAPA